MSKFLLWLLASSLSAVFYRLGGWNKGNRLFRVLGCPLMALVLFLALQGFKLGYIWAYVLSFGLSSGAISAYWGLDEQKWGYWVHGLGLSIAALPLTYIMGHWLGFAIRTIVLTALMCIWSEKTGWDVLEEGGRGFIYCATVPLLLI